MVPAREVKGTIAHGYQVRRTGIPRNGVQHFYVVLAWKKSAVVRFCSFFGGPFNFQIANALSCHVRGGNRRCRRHRWLLIVSGAILVFVSGPELFVSSCVWPNVKLPECWAGPGAAVTHIYRLLFSFRSASKMGQKSGGRDPADVGKHARISSRCNYFVVFIERRS